MQLLSSAVCPKHQTVGTNLAALKLLCSFVSISLQDDATEAEWYDVTQLPALAFDHKLIIRTAFQHLLQHSETNSAGELGFSQTLRRICWVFCLPIYVSCMFMIVLLSSIRRRSHQHTAACTNVANELEVVKLLSKQHMSAPHFYRVPD